MRSAPPPYTLLLLCLIGAGGTGACTAPESKPRRTVPPGAAVVTTLGHGTFFTTSAPTTDPTLELIQNTQIHYIAKLEGSDAADRIIRSRQRIYDEAEDPVVANATYLEDLIEAVAPPNRATLVQINIALRRHYLERIQGGGAIHVESNALTTTNGGSAYRNECINNGVPVPETVLDDSDARWVNHGVLADPVLSPLAEVWSYVSDVAEGEPRGICIALPRWNMEDEAELLGLICLGQDSSKVCFFDNPDTVSFPRYETLDIDDFVGGAELVTNGGGVCTDCHAGENPFVVHPEEEPFAEFRNRVKSPFALSWPEPIVSAAWMQNPPPITRLGPVGSGQRRCDTCHIAGGLGGRLPLLSSDMTGYCGAVLPKAVGSGGTMPPGGDISDYADHKDWLQALCENTAGAGQVVEIDPPTGIGYLSPPTVERPLYACATQVEVTGARLDGLLELYIDGDEVDSRTVRNPYSEVFTLEDPLEENQEVEAKLIVGMEEATSASVDVVDHTEDYPEGLPPPAIAPATAHECGEALAVQVVRGADLEVEKVDGGSTVSGSPLPGFSPTYRYVSFSGNAFDAGDQLKARQRLCEEDAWSDWSEIVTATTAPSSLPEVTFNPPYVVEGQELVNLESIVEGAVAALDEDTTETPVWSEGSWPLTWAGPIDVVDALETSIQSTHELVPTQELCEVASDAPSNPPDVLSCSELPAPVIAPPQDGDDFVLVIEAVPGATIRVLDATKEIGGGAGAVILLDRALQAGETIVVVQEVGSCTGSSAYSITVGGEEE